MILLLMLLICGSIVRAAAAGCIQSIVAKAYDSYNSLPATDKQIISAADYANLLLKKSGYEPISYQPKKKTDISAYVDQGAFNDPNSGVSKALNVQDTLRARNVPITTLVPTEIHMDTGKGIVELAPQEDVILKATISKDGITGINNKALENAYLTSDEVSEVVQSAIKLANDAKYDVKNGAQVLIARTPDGELKAMFNSADIGAALDNLPANTAPGIAPGTLSQKDVTAIPDHLAYATSLTSRLHEAVLNPALESDPVIRTNAQKLLSLPIVGDTLMNNIVDALKSVSTAQSSGDSAVIEAVKAQAKSKIINSLPVSMTTESETAVADALVNGKEIPPVEIKPLYQILAFFEHIL